MIVWHVYEGPYGDWCVCAMLTKNGYKFERRHVLLQRELLPATLTEILNELSVLLHQDIAEK